MPCRAQNHLSRISYTWAGQEAMCRRTGVDHILVAPICGSVTDMMEQSRAKGDFPLGGSVLLSGSDSFTIQYPYTFDSKCNSSDICKKI